MLNQTPQANRLHIAIFGRRNVGKSSLVNALTGQDIAVVSDVPGTTTDPVFKSMEILPIGPVMVVDTAGLDDAGNLGQLRVTRTRKVLDRTDLAVLVCSPTERELDVEKGWLNELARRGIPVIGVLNKIDLGDVDLAWWQSEMEIPFVKVSATNKWHIDDLVRAITLHAPVEAGLNRLISDIVEQGQLVVLVAPPDTQAPKGRLKLVQAQVIRDLLDKGATSILTTDEELPSVLRALNRQPDLVITDAQVFSKVAAALPVNVPLTSFSVVMARHKGDLAILVEGAKAIDTLVPGDEILIAEGCTHHALQGDLARQRLPEWLAQKSGGKLSVTVTSGTEFPDDLSRYRLVLHCGACMLTRRQFVSRIQRAAERGVPITNFGTAIAYLDGALGRVTEMFPELQGGESAHSTVYNGIETAQSK